MKKPNLFFIGAPKCGTTSIAYQLSRHPEIFMSNPKEPHFFEEDIDRGVKNIKEYESLFKNVQNHHKVVGEASTGYLYSKDAVKNALSYSPEAKILVSIRNPYEMAISLFYHNCRQLTENANNFSEAWNLQNDRRKGLNVPRACLSQRLLLYSDRCSLGDQLQKLYEEVDSAKIYVAIFDDLKNNPSSFYKNLYNFLDVRVLFSEKFPVLNEKIEIKHKFIVHSLRSLGKLKRKLGLSKSIGLATWILNKTSSSFKQKVEIDEEVFSKMDKVFNPQINKIENIVKRDLKNWCNYRP